MTNHEMIINGAKELGVDIAPNIAENMLKYMDFMLEWNEKVNLTAVTDTSEVIIKHFLDSITLIATNELKPNARIIDVGTGAGFPAIPLRLVRTDIRLSMLDSLGKRVNFLKEACNLVGIDDAECMHGRAEDIAQNVEYREKFDIATARAVAGLNVLCEYCLPLLAVGGKFLAMKGPDIKDELKTAEKAISLLGGRLVDVKSFKLPFSDITHSVIVIEKIKKCSTKFPRKAGKPSKEPII